MGYILAHAREEGLVGGEIVGVHTLALALREAERILGGCDGAVIAREFACQSINLASTFGILIILKILIYWALAIAPPITQEILKRCAFASGWIVYTDIPC